MQIRLKMSWCSISYVNFSWVNFLYNWLLTNVPFIFLFFIDVVFLFFCHLDNLDLIYYYFYSPACSLLLLLHTFKFIYEWILFVFIYFILLFMCCYLFMLFILAYFSNSSVFCIGGGCWFWLLWSWLGPPWSGRSIPSSYVCDVWISPLPRSGHVSMHVAGGRRWRPPPGADGSLR